MSKKLHSLEPLSRSSLHHTSQVATPRFPRPGSSFTDPKVALDLVRSLIQADLNQKVQGIMQEYIESYFQPAVLNIQNNLGAASEAGVQLLEEVCSNALQHAVKEMFSLSNPGRKLKGPDGSKRTKSTGRRPFAAGRGQKGCRWLQPDTDLVLITRQGKPVRREGWKWEPKRLAPHTAFVLMPRASRLGSRMCIRHPSLFRYCCDQADLDWLLQHRRSAISACNAEGNLSSGNVFLVVLEDLRELCADSGEELTPGLCGFQCPLFMIKKMRSCIRAWRTNPADTDETLIQQAHRHISNCDMSVSSGLNQLRSNGAQAPVTGSAHAEIAQPSQPQVQQSHSDNMFDDLLDNEDDLGFLQGVNLSSLVREFEIEASTSGTQNLTILSLEDDAETQFAPLPHAHPESNMDELNDLHFD